MKKLSSYILAFIIGITVFAPFGIAITSQSVVAVEKNIADAADCEIVSAYWNPEGEQKKDGSDRFFRKGVTAKIVVKTKDCVGQPSITLTVFEADTCVLANCDDALENSGFLRRPINIPTDNFTVNIKLGEEKCEAGATLAVGYDCDLFFYIRQGNNVLYNSFAETKDLYYECDGACDTNAAFLGITPQGTNEAPLKDDAVPVDATKAIINNDTYTLLAPIGDLKEINTSGGTCPGNPDLQNGIGCYLNILFKLAIGLCGALAVIMIIISGVQYMGDESVFGKTEAKSKILSAIFGLLIALGAYALLNTINPALTGENGVTVDQVSADIEGDDEAGSVGYQKYISAGKPGKGITGYDFQAAKFPSGIICPAKGMGQGDISTIAKSFSNKITYAQLENPPKGPRGTNTNTGHFFLDCSSYVTTVLKCSGINPPAYAHTAQLFSNAEPTSASQIKVSGNDGYVNGIKLNIGDLVGWTKYDKGSKGSGHVMIYVGGGQLLDSHGGPGRNPGMSVTKPFSLINSNTDRIHWVKRVK